MVYLDFLAVQYVLKLQWKILQMENQCKIVNLSHCLTIKESFETMTKNLQGSHFESKEKESRTEATVEGIFCMLGHKMILGSYLGEQCCQSIDCAQWQQL